MVCIFGMFKMDCLNLGSYIWMSINSVVDEKFNKIMVSFLCYIDGCDLNVLFGGKVFVRLLLFFCLWFGNGIFSRKKLFRKKMMFGMKKV